MAVFMLNLHNVTTINIGWLESKMAMLTETFYGKNVKDMTKINTDIIS